MKRMLTAGLAGFLAVTLPGCSSTATADAPAATLAGTSWKLVSFQSPKGAVVPPSLENYALEFRADGSMPMRLDCNRANARWEAKPSSPEGGTIAIKAGFMTRAMCQQGALDREISSDMERVRAYTLKEGRLGLVLEGDAGVYVWEKAAALEG